jgi:hypothetical protein
VSVHLLGIRHHGPGSARALLQALDELAPDAVLVELPADCQPALRWVADDGLHPPVALLGYDASAPQRAAFLPFAEFSPEWCAFSWAHRHGVELRAIDLPLANVLAGDDDELHLGGAPLDPLAALAAAASDPDPERWWDDVVEHRRGGLATFAAVAEAMGAVRSTGGATSAVEARREAHMRRAMRTAIADGFARVAVVVGAWHVPALAGSPSPGAADQRTLRGLPKIKVGISWVPWTHRRLATASGYGAGVRSPGWYAHMFHHPGGDGVTRWFVEAARLLRDRGLAAAPDDLIAARRAAVALATLRLRPAPGLAEVLDAAETVMAGRDGMPLISDQLVIGDAIGSVPAGAPQVPLAADLTAAQRRLRLRPRADVHTVELDLRTPLGRNRSVLLHRLRALGVPWGRLTEGRGSSGTFRETWTLRWEPEVEIRVIELSGHGTTVRAAAAARLIERMVAADTLAELAVLLEVALLGDLAEVVERCVARISAQATHDPDVAHLVDTLEPLARTLRYGDVRGTDVLSLRAAVDGVVVRVLAGLVGACTSLDDGAAAAWAERLTAAHAALSLLDHPARHTEWPAVLDRLAARSDVHGLVRGRAVRLSHDGQWSTADAVQQRFGQALTPGTPPAVGAAFVEGFVAGSGVVLVHDRQLLALIDGWIAALAPDAFVATVPLLRRTFGAFEAGERRQLGLLLSARSADPAHAGSGELDEARVAAAVNTVRHLLGVPS